MPDLVNFSYVPVQFFATILLDVNEFFNIFNRGRLFKSHMITKPKRTVIAATYLLILYSQDFIGEESVT